MAHIENVYIFKKHSISYKKQTIEIFEFLDYVAAITFRNTNHNERCNIITGDYANQYANIISEDVDDDELTYLTDNLEKSIKQNHNDVDFDEIRKAKRKNTLKYYVRNGETGLKGIDDKNLTAFLQEELSKKHSDFDENEFEKATDISSMYSSIKKTIISQDEQIMKILTALFKNQKVVNSDIDKDLIAKLKENILIFGSTGTGKTEIIKRIANLYNIPIVIEDATSLSETGYVGRKITDMLEDLYLAADNDIKLAERGILVIDEFDKLAEKENSNNSHVSRYGVQRSLLKLLDGSLFYFDNKKFDTSKLTVIGLGAFTGITKDDNYEKLNTDDFMKYGIMRELIGRFSKTIPMNPLSKDDIIKILKESDFSPLNTYKSLFEMLNVTFDYTDDFIEYIADIAIKKQSGARSLKTVFDDAISSALFRIFAGEYTHISLIKPDDENKNPYILTKEKEKKHGLFKKK